ncbi:hypothetical protein LOD99_4517 [Oopsacas minuta]|uniref:WD repeat-containing protein 79 n=1 Tax=Oopsacas minuta TaxID=111878 RepID=A0AAV7JT88_9METZ|nr:hypothetical protein LOD99_4517 [Oopsacas minuta]
MQLANQLINSAIPNPLTHISADYESGHIFNNYLRGCKWSPDGTCLLTSSNDKCMRIFELDLILDSSFDSTSSSAALVLYEPEIVYDYAWYPAMCSEAPLTCCLVTTSRDCPVHLWDAYTGSVRCSYLPYDHVQELHAPYSVCFSADGDYIICGMKHYLKVFHTAIPGSYSTNIQLVLGKKHIPNNIVSTVTTRGSAILFGSFGGNVGLVGETGKIELLLEAHTQGVTHIDVTADGNYVVAGGRKNNNIFIWDLRNTTQFVAKLNRISLTSQKIYFDIDKSNSIVSGNQDGNISVWSEYTWKSHRENLNGISPDSQILAHKDSVNGISVHPSRGLIASASGERKFWVDFDLEYGEDEEMSTVSSENCIKIWNNFNRFI